MMQKTAKQKIFTENDKEVTYRKKTLNNVVSNQPNPLVLVNPPVMTNVVKKEKDEKKLGGNKKSSEAAIKLLENIESLRLKPYDDQTGKEINQLVEGATIGYGKLIIGNEWSEYKDGITEQTASNLFKANLSQYENAVNTVITASLNQQQYDALVILAYNIGISAFKMSSVVKMINQPNAKTVYSSLESAWKAFNKSQGKVSQGLEKRRKAEWKIYSTGVYEE